MATLAGLRTLTLAYLGTTASDPAYPPATLNALLNAAGNKLIADIQQQKPDYFQTFTTLIPAFPGDPTYRSYTLPAEYAGWLDVRIGDLATGRPTKARLREVRQEELVDACVPSFAVSWPDGKAELWVSDNVPLDAFLWMLYRMQPDEMVADADTPDWLPTPYHDLLARMAAIDAFGLGNESAPSPLFVESTRDREAQLWVAIGRRGIAPTIQR